MEGGIFVTRTISLLLILVLFLGLSSCIYDKDNPFPYRGEYKELYTAAIYGIPDTEGYMHHGEGAYDADIHIWEQDDYGRTLFSYCEDYGNEIFALVICQAYDEKDVYFYPDQSYILTRIDSRYMYEGVEEDHLKNRTEAFYLEYRDKLKAENDWDLPMDKSKCVSYPITDHKPQRDDTHCLTSAQYNEILNEYSKTLPFSNLEERPYAYHKILQVDTEGRVLHEIYGSHGYYDNPDHKWSDDFTCYYIILWVITDKDGNYDKEAGIKVMYSRANEYYDSFTYDPNEIREFKTGNGWKNK